MKKPKTSVSNLVKCMLVLLGLVFFAVQADATLIEYEARPLYTVFGDPDDYIVSPGGLLDGVGEIRSYVPGGYIRTTGALLPTGRHVLTCAHGVTDDFGAFNTDITGTNVIFEGAGGDVTIPVVGYNVHPSWNGDYLRGYDITVLELASEAPADIDRYDIDRTMGDEIGATVDKVGYGRSGTGATGYTLPGGTKREGDNIYDAIADVMYAAIGGAPAGYQLGSILQYDFDNGSAGNDAFGYFFGIPHLGLGEDEVLSAPGDSGGPTFDASGNIVGVTSYGLTLWYPDGSSSDVDAPFPTLNSSFGEFAGDTRVAYYADFVDGITGVAVPEPSMLVPLITGLGCMIGYVHLRRRKA